MLCFVCQKLSSNVSSKRPLDKKSIHLSKYLYLNQLESLGKMTNLFSIYLLIFIDSAHPLIEEEKINENVPGVKQASCSFKNQMHICLGNWLHSYFFLTLTKGNQVTRLPADLQVSNCSIGLVVALWLIPDHVLLFSVDSVIVVITVPLYSVF